MSFHGNMYTFIPKKGLSRFKETYPSFGSALANLRALSSRCTVGAGDI